MSIQRTQFPEFMDGKIGTPPATSAVQSSKHHRPQEQEAIRAKCFHPSGRFVEFPIEDVETSIPARFERMVQLRAGQIAFKSETDSVTYTQLNGMANRFAYALLQRFGRRVEVIALLLEKNAAQIAAMLGTMKAGKFFLILDPSFPKARLASMLEESRANAVITNLRNSLLAAQIAKPGCSFMQWEALDDSIPACNPKLSVTPKALAFINYTSGSTGEPKGLLRTHRMILHNIMLRTNLIHVCEYDRISLLSSGTSNAITNSFLALLNGAGLYSLDVKKDGVGRLAQWLAEEKVTIGPMSSPLFRSLCDMLKGTNNFPDLRVIRLRSEAVYKSDVDLYKQSFSPKCIFVTGLSSNETGPLADYLIDHDVVINDAAVPVGYGARDKDLVLLGDRGKPIGFGEIGEIAVRSRYLFPGYWRNPRLTRAKFERDPGNSKSRLYRTGDMGLMLRDGCLIHKGRKDFRVKVRGYPVDIKEVEIALRSHPWIWDVVITIRQRSSGESFLAAYFVTGPEQVPTVSELVRFLAQMLPEHMIPGVFVRLGSLPLNPQNKVDRTALPPPPERRPHLDTPFMNPRCDEERALAEIWAEVLGIDRVGVQDNFLDLGGHSLAATRIVMRVVETFHVELPLQLLFDSPTVEQMGAVIRDHQAVGHEPAEHMSNRSDAAASPKPVASPIDFMPFTVEDVDGSVPERFEKIVRLYPDRIAVKTCDQAITYAQLNAMANRMARTLVERRGRHPEAVAVLIANGPRLMAAILAVLKAGKFFTLLDSSFPKARNEALLEDSQAGLVITDSENALFAGNISKAPSRLLGFDSVDSYVSPDNLGLCITPVALAAVVYTSGSTGEPKGVMWSHEDLLHRILLRTIENQPNIHDRIALLTTGTANTVTNSLLALLNGATLCPFAVQIEGVGRLAKWLSREGITICPFSSSLFRSLTAVLTGSETFPDLRIVRLRSETVRKIDFELFRKHFPNHCAFVTGLSTSETGQLTTHVLNHNSVIPDARLPIGFPMPDKEILLLDEDGHDVGVNRVGEIVVRSRHLAVGYWRKPELTALRFTADPSGNGQRLCFTGDLGMRLPDGSLLHKGRKDFRVKIRGYGVEFEEVEQCLASHPGVRQAAVLLQSYSGGPRLAAYYTAATHPPPRAKELREFIAAKLPDYMIPAAFVLLDQLPLTPNGKMDRRSLPEPGNSCPDRAAASVQPGNDAEKKLVSIWEDVLDVRPIGVNDDFFELGGDSLSASQVISQVIDHFHLEISLQRLFESPRIADMAALIARHQMGRSRCSEAIHVAELSSVGEARERFLPLSYSQQRLWFLDQLEPGGFTYNLFRAHRLKGDLDVAALERSFNEIVQRHEILRTVFQSKDGNVAQIVLSRLAVNMPLIDLRSIETAEDRWTKVREMFREEAQQPFDLTTGPLLRIKLLRLGDDEYVLLRTIHHIVSDGWSEGVLLHELAEIYAALSTGKSSPLSDLPTQYAEYANWQRQWFRGERLESQLSYWKKQLDNVETFDLPTDRPRHPLQTRCGRRRYFALSDNLSSELKTLAREHGATLFMTLLAAFQTLLHRYTHQTDVAIGSPVAGRTRKEFEDLIGFFLNMLVLRVDLSGNPTFVETLARVREVCLGALSHQELPFEKLVEELHPERALGQNPLFQVTFAFQNTPRASLRLSDISVEELEVETGIARFDLHLFMEEEDGHLQGYFDYDAGLFNPDTIERMTGHFQTLLDGIVADPARRISDLPLLTEAETDRLLIEWNDTRIEYPREECIQDLFQAQVERAPEAVALVFEDQKITYQELNARANQLAHWLRRQGVGPDDFVAILMERSIELVIAILGILKSGGAYLPIDPDLPNERIQFFLRDAQVKWLLLQDKLRFRVAGFDGQIICPDGDRAKFSNERRDNLRPAAEGRHAAYVIYTSGSTGTPKAVVNVHDGLRNRIQWMQQAYPLSASDRVLQKTSCTFDVSVWEFLWPLSAGACLVLARPGGHRDSGYLIELIQAQKITALHFVPSMLGVFLQEPGVERCSSLGRVFCSGEALPAELQQRFFARSSAALYNLYGPTEASIEVSAWECRRDGASKIVPIGRPIANTHIYILDGHMNPVSIGAAGEIYIGGVGLARGYLHRPELTAEKFVPNPFSPEPGLRLYKTGDVARYLPDGRIEYLGRIDNQIKVRGYRIEPGEIEALLDQHPSVLQSVVAAREDRPGDKRLVAYVVAPAGSSIEAAELRTYLKQKLPDYMLPSAWVAVDKLPLTPNGKLDRKALPAPDQGRPEPELTYQAPRTLLEEGIATIWREVLRLDKVGVHDNFFDLGGHSLSATQVVSRMRDVFDVEIALRTMFESPTVQHLAAVIARARATTPDRIDAVEKIGKQERNAERC